LDVVEGYKVGNSTPRGRTPPGEVVN